MKQNIFIHGKEEIIETKGQKSVAGYGICKAVVDEETGRECRQEPAFAWNSGKPDIIRVITCEHITEKPKL